LDKEFLVSGTITAATSTSLAYQDYIEVINLQVATAAIAAITHTVGRNK